MNQAYMRNRIAHTYPSRSLHGSIVHELGEKIVSGVYAPGSTLPIEEELREELGVSRNALREAVKVLSAKGLLKVKTRTGTCVQPRENWHLTDPDVLSWSMSGAVDRDLISWLTEFRKVIEPAAAEMAASRATKDEREGIMLCMKALEIACDQLDAGECSMEKCVDVDMSFHESIFSAAGNPFLQSVTANIGAALALSRTVTDGVPGALRRSLPNHRKVALAVVEGRTLDARSAMLALCEGVAEDVEKALGDPPISPKGR